MKDNGNNQPATDVVKPRLEQTRAAQRFCPAVDIIELEPELLVLADMPGANKDSIDVRFENGALTIHGRVSPRQGPNAQYAMREYSVGDYYRVFQVSESIDPSAITAEYTDGVLRLRLPKVEAVRTRRIAVQG